METKRKGKFFEIFWPELYDWRYPWPTQDYKEYENLFLQNKSELESMLLEKVKSNMEKVGIETGHFPTLQSSKDSITFHIENGGRWLTLEKYIFSSIVSGHNLDYLNHKIVAFNAAADTLEHLDEEILAPRVEFDNSPEGFHLKYPFPKGLEKIPLEEHKGSLSKAYSLVHINNFNLSKEDENNKIYFEYGAAKFREGVCELKAERNFEKYSWAVSRTLGFLQSEINS